MNRLVLFVFFVLLAAGAIMVVANQNGTKSQNLASNTDAISTSPTQTTTDPTQSTPQSQISTTISPSSTEQTVSAQKAIIKTDKGDIEVDLYADIAPKTVANFVTKATSGFYNNLTFHRVEDWVVQGGDPLGNGTGGGNMPVEFNNKPFVVGSLGIASRGDGKVQNDAQFFFTTKEASWLNGAYTNFGIVTKGMEIVNKIQIGDKILGITTQ